MLVETERCLRSGQLLHLPELSCYEPLGQDPCSDEDSWFVLDSWDSGEGHPIILEVGVRS